MEKPLNKVITALITPFKNGKIDEESFKSLLKFQLDKGISGFVINGTTAESPTLTQEEREHLFKLAKSFVPSSTTLIMGTGSNSTAETIQQTRRAENLGADAALVVVPYYNKPPQRGLAQHFVQVAECSGLNIILYNVPGRTITALDPETTVELAKNKKICGIKEASGKIEYLKQIKSQVPTSFALLTGDDETYVDFLAAGGQGVISVASHIIPETMLKWQRHPVSDWREPSQELNDKRKLIQLLFCEANPIPVKMALYKMGIISSPEMRLPLVELTPKLTDELSTEMKTQGLL